MKAITFRSATLFLGHAVFIALVVLAWQHAALRMTNGDTANQFFKWLNYDGLSAEAHRYSAIVPQLVVKAMLPLGCNLSEMMVAASIAHVIVGYAVFLICAHVWRANASALSVTLAAVLCSRLSFYSPVLEANYLLCYPFLCFGFLEHMASAEVENGWTRVKAVALSVPCLLVHPLGGLLLSCGVIAMWSIRSISWRPALAVVAVSVLWTALGKLVFPPTEYESEQYAKLVAGSADLANIAQWHSVEFLIGHTWRDTTAYLPLWVVTGVLVFMLWRSQGLRAVAVILGMILGFVLMNLVTFHGGDSAVMLDRSILPLATIVALPFCVLLARAKRVIRTVAFSVLVVVLFLKFRDVSFASRQFAERYAAIEQVLGSMKESGATNAIVESSTLGRMGLTSWALPCEVMLISTVEDPSSTKVFISTDVESSVGGVQVGEFPLLGKKYHYYELRYLRPPADEYIRLRLEQ